MLHENYNMMKVVKINYSAYEIDTINRVFSAAPTSPIGSS